MGKLNDDAQPCFMAGGDCQSDEPWWWIILSNALIALMDRAAYSKEQQKGYAAFVSNRLVPFLGPRPKALSTPHFDNFCNDDFSPVELSWDFHIDVSTVHVGFEPIGQVAGTSQNPFNAIQTESVIHHLLAYDERVKSDLWRHFSKDFTDSTEKAHSVVACMAPNEHMSSNTVSLDLVGDPLPKVYFYPIVAAISEHEFAGEMVAASLKRLLVDISPALGIIEAYVAEAKVCYGNQFVRLECLSCNAIEPANSRSKLYIRTAHTSLAKTNEIFTLSGRLLGDEVTACLHNLSSFWSLVFQTHADDAELPPSDHRTAGTIFNFELRHGESVPRPKVYMPVRHYGGTDLEVAQGISRFLHKIVWSDLASSYVEDVQSIS